MTFKLPVFGVTVPTWDQPNLVCEDKTIYSITSTVDLLCDQQWRTAQTNILQYSTFKGDWDGLGSSPAKPTAIKTSNAYLKQFREKARYSAPNSVTLTPDGCIRVEWWTGDNVRQAEFGAANQIEWAQFGPNLKPQYWAEPFEPETRATRGIVWDQSVLEEESGAASIAAT